MAVYAPTTTDNGDGTWTVSEGLCFQCLCDQCGDSLTLSWDGFPPDCVVPAGSRTLTRKRPPSGPADACYYDYESPGKIGCVGYQVSQVAAVVSLSCGVMVEVFLNGGFDGARSYYARLNSGGMVWPFPGSPTTLHTAAAIYAAADCCPFRLTGLSARVLKGYFSCNGLTGPDTLETAYTPTFSLTCSGGGYGPTPTPADGSAAPTADPPQLEDWSP